MLERLGKVLYWLGCGFAVLFAIGGIFAGVLDGRKDHSDQVAIFLILEALALISWGIGKGLRYILCGK